MMRIVLCCLLAVVLFPLAGHAAYTDNGDGTVADSVTGLVWQKDGKTRVLAWADSLAYCEGLDLGGQTDWRLPDRKEMLSLVDFSAADSPMIDKVLVSDTSAALYWTSTTSANAPGSALAASFLSGALGGDPKWLSKCIRCVRGGPAGSPDPLAVLSGAPAGSTGSASVSITVSGTGVAKYRYKLDSGNFTQPTDVSEAISLSGLAGGAHTLAVLGINSAGKLQADPTTATWTVQSTTVTPGDGTDPHTDPDSSNADTDITFPAYDEPAYNASALAEMTRLGLPPGSYNLGVHTSWQSGVTDATALTYLKSGSSTGIGKGINLMSANGEVDRVLTGLINATTPALACGYALFVRNTSNLARTYTPGELRYAKIVGNNATLIPVSTTEYSTSVAEDVHAYLRDGKGNVVTDSFNGTATLYVWVKDNGAYDADTTSGIVADPGVLSTSAPSSSSSSNNGCALNPSAGFGPEWLLLALAPAAAVPGRRRNRR